VSSKAAAPREILDRDILEFTGTSGRKAVAIISALAQSDEIKRAMA
jgi:hypothetical protein